MGFDELVEHIGALARAQADIARGFAALGKKVKSLESVSLQTVSSSQATDLHDAITQIIDLSDARHKRVDDLVARVDAQSADSSDILRELDSVKIRLARIDNDVADIVEALKDRREVVLDLKSASKKPPRAVLQKTSNHAKSENPKSTD